MIQPSIEAFFDEPINTISYLVGDPATRTAVTYLRIPVRWQAHNG